MVCLENHPRNEKIEPGENLSKRNDLTGMVLRHLNLSHCLLDRCSFDNADLRGSDLTYADCTGSTFIKAVFKGGKAGGTIFKDADLTGMLVEGAEFSGAVMAGERLTKGLRDRLVEEYV